MLNRLTFHGRMCETPELKTTQSGLSVCRFTVAQNEKHGDQEIATYLPCTAWRTTAEFLSKFFEKGQEILIEGKFRSRTYQDKDGRSRTAYECVVDSADFCGPKKDATPYSQLPDAPEGLMVSDNDLPF